MGLYSGAAPTFKMHGSKARIAKWIVSQFPDVTHYAEPFAGRGNVFFRLLNTQQPQQVRLNDTRTHKFLAAIRDHAGDFDFIPEDPITRETYRHFSSMSDCPEKWIAECCVAYNGNYYGRGANITEDSKNRHNKQRTIARLKNARAALRSCDVVITSQDWYRFIAALPGNYFIYADPPYFGTQSIYPNIDHTALVDVLNAIDNKFVLSGYDFGQYENLDCDRVETRSRASVAKARRGASGDDLRKVETIWIRGW